jgi:hypothetical protein
MRYSLKQAKGKDFCLSSTGDPEPTGKGTSIDHMDKVSEFWDRHCVSPCREMLARRVMFPELALHTALCDMQAARTCRAQRVDQRELGPRDMIDIQSFLWVQGSAEYDE